MFIVFRERQKEMTNNKKGFRASKLILAVLILVMIFSAFGCGGQKHKFEPDITVEYLTTEYADQLVRDGAEVVFGTLDITGEASGTPVEGSEEPVTLTQFTINAKEYVTDENAEGGYYIADRNKSYITYAGSDARIAFDFAGTGTLDIVSLDEFVKHDTTGKYFDVYLFDDQIVLILEHII